MLLLRVDRGARSSKAVINHAYAVASAYQSQIRLCRVAVPVHHSAGSSDTASCSRTIRFWQQVVPEGGHLIIASSADDGPDRCSDLDAAATPPNHWRPNWANVSRSSERPGRCTLRLRALRRRSCPGSSGDSEPGS